MDHLTATAVIIPVLIVAYVVAITLKSDSGNVSTNFWLLPASLSAAFFAYTVVAIYYEGVIQVFVSHTETFWGVQVWLDLVLAVAIGLTFILPEARRLGMNVIPWVLLSISTGCIGLLAMVARVFYLKTHDT